MPELPEVENVRLGLLPLQGLSVTGIKMIDGHLRQPIPNNTEILIGKKLNQIERRAKYLIFHFEELQFTIHLGMTGRLLLRSNVLKHDKLLFQFGSECLYFNDTRRFGLATWAHNINWAKVGVEPLSPLFTSRVLATLLNKTTQPIKNFLLNQQYVAGLGNIYVCEALFLAKISPFRQANTLTTPEIEMLHKSIINVLHQAISKGGSTLRDYRGVDGRTGDFQNEFLVYDREGTPCPVCGKPITREKQQGRSSYWCTICQK